MSEISEIRPIDVDALDDRVRSWAYVFDRLRVYTEGDISPESLALTAAMLVAPPPAAMVKAAPTGPRSFVVDPDGDTIWDQSKDARVAPVRRVRPGAVCKTCGEGIDGSKDVGVWRADTGWTHAVPKCLLPKTFNDKAMSSWDNPEEVR